MLKMKLLRYYLKPVFYFAIIQIIIIIGNSNNDVVVDGFIVKPQSTATTTTATTTKISKRAIQRALKTPAFALNLMQYPHYNNDNNYEYLSATSKMNNEIHDADNDKYWYKDILLNRRTIFTRCTASVVLSLISIPSVSAMVNDDDDDNNNTDTTTVISKRDKVADMLHVIPTFTIVDETGVPYMVVGEDAKITGYFFTTYNEANRILQLAKTSAEKAIQQAIIDKEPGYEELSNPWLVARITTVPLDTAVTLALGGTTQQRVKNYFQVAPAEDDIEIALQVTGKDDIQEGKVPLFYYSDFTIDGNTPLYFSKAQLEQAYKKQNKGVKNLPDAMVTELFAVLTEMVKPDTTDPDIEKLIIIPPLDSNKRAKECIKRQSTQFLLGKRNIIL